KGNVLSVADLEGVEEQLQKTPAAQVIFFDDVPVNGDKGKSGPNQLVDQFWLVIVVVKNVKGKSGAEARKQAGPIIAGVIKQLHHFDPGHPYSKLTRVKAPYRATYRNGFFYFPMMFKTRFSTEGNKNGRS
ncbi:MAG: hypothetical protein GQ532_14535, partial [Methylomarinum sp.]|nr:hypothetical protein [Methylomarinum sp.]